MKKHSKRFHSLLSALVACFGVFEGCDDEVVAHPEDDDIAEVSDVGAELPPPNDVPADAGALVPVLKVDVTAIDFGLQNCGVLPATVTSVHVTNPGFGPLVVSARRAPDGQYEIVGCDLNVAVCAFAPDSADFSLKPGGTAEIRLRPLTTTGNAGDLAKSTLEITSNDPKLPKYIIPVQHVSAGGTLRLKPESVNFPPTPVNTEQTLNLNLYNAGNVAVEVAVEASTDSHFNVKWAGPAAGVTLEPGASVPGLEVSFKPTSIGLASISLKLQVKGSLCGDGVTSINITGQGSNGSVGLGQSAVDFGAVGCGTQAKAQKIQLTNAGNATFHFTMTLHQGVDSPYSVTATSDAVAAGASVELIVQPKPVPSAHSTATDSLFDTLQIQTDVLGDTPHIIALHQSARGAILAWAQATLHLRSTPIGSTQAATVALHNFGNDDAQLYIESSNPVATASPALPIDLLAWSTAAASLSYAPVEFGVQSGEISVQVSQDTVLCAPLPANVTWTGLGAEHGVAVSAASLDFGATDCGKTAAPQNVVITNLSDSLLKWTATLGKAKQSNFTIGSDSGSIDVGQSAVVQVVPNAVPAISSTTYDGLSDQLFIATDVADDLPHVVALHQTAHGAVLAWHSALLNFSTTALNQAATQTYAVQNTGNAAAAVKVIGDKASFSAAGPNVVPAFGEAWGQAQFKGASAAGRSQGQLNLTVDAGTPLCQPLPPPLHLLATTSFSDLMIEPQALSFGRTACGTTAPAQQLSVTNTGKGPMKINAGLAGKNFIVSPAVATVDAGQTLLLTLTPKLVPAQTPVTPNLFGDTLVITTNSPGEKPREIPLFQTARGAILSLSASNLTWLNVPMGSTMPQDVAMTNTGNEPIQVGFKHENAVFSAQRQALAPFGSRFVAVTFQPIGAVDFDQLQLDVDDQTPLCGPLPSGVAVNGTAVDGGLVANPSVLQFGQVNCGGVVTGRNVLFRNHTGASLNWAATLKKGSGSAFYLSSSSGFIDNGGIFTIKVTPLPLPNTAQTTLDQFGDILTITTTSPDVPVLQIPLHESAQGAILSLSPPNWVFGDVGVLGAKYLPFFVKNSGNSPALLTLSVAPPGTWNGWLPETVVAGGGHTAVGALVFLPTSLGPFFASFSISSSSPLCAPLPLGAANLIGTGK